MPDLRFVDVVIPVFFNCLCADAGAVRVVGTVNQWDGHQPQLDGADG